MVEERALLSRLRALDEDALGMVYDTFQPSLYRYAYRLLGHTEAAEDVAAETFRRLLQDLYRGRGPKRNLQSWLYRVAHNLVVDLYRHRPARAPLPLEDVTLVGVDAPDEQVQRRLAQERIQRALQELTSDQRHVIVLKFLEGMENQEVATVLGKSVGAVKSLQHRALAALRRILVASASTDQEEAL